MDALNAISIYVLGMILGGIAVYMSVRHLMTVNASQAANLATADARSATLRADDLAVRLSGVEGRLREKESELRSVDAELTKLKTERATFETRLEELGRIHDKMKDAFASLSAEALKTTNETFLQVAKRELEGVRAV
jgi:DNA recombination protein RmuC